MPRRHRLIRGRRHPTAQLGLDPRVELRARELLVGRQKIVESESSLLVEHEHAPEASGAVVIDFTIGEQGTVTKSTVASSDMKDAAAPACMSEAIAGWLFPRPDGGSVEVSYPFVLEPG